MYTSLRKRRINKKNIYIYISPIFTEAPSVCICTKFGTAVVSWTWSTVPSFLSIVSGVSILWGVKICLSPLVLKVAENCLNYRSDWMVTLIHSLGNLIYHTCTHEFLYYCKPIRFSYNMQCLSLESTEVYLHNIIQVFHKFLKARKRENRAVIRKICCIPLFNTE